MKFLRNYNIDIIKLKDGRHTFQFEVGDDFFKFFEAEDWINGSKVTVIVTLNKTASVIEAEFKFSGTVRLTCDRSLEEFDHPLDFTEKVIYKYGPIEQEISEDVFMITRDTPSINIAQLVYEFILLAIPAKKIHPDYAEEMDDEGFEDEGSLVYLSEELESDEIEELEDGEENPEKPVDPRWEILNKLKKKD
ncbi:YceD family protein [Cecembia calidifontis]|uniref:Uncharacterized metal-binding protein YceD (DUF177 family) n=1 Tax=Cecembia calidifontis TaxID=1187080 RepID=A0A4Q7P9H3_9BACT|nr:DUF177 domain-containing protein [Cecembia calidifontis]RZS96876.1 uncharacterized metal-binding protein YceD (DUF177 family) [Cecembia calidifontis]